MRFLLRAIFWLALAYALIPSRAPVPASLKASAPAPEQAQAPVEAAGNTSLARDAITLCIDNPKSCAAGVEAVGRMAEMARAAGARFTDTEAVAKPAGTTSATSAPAAASSPATHTAPVPLPTERPSGRR